jgi:hypothetical protein
MNSNQAENFKRVSYLILFENFHLILNGKNIQLLKQLINLQFCNQTAQENVNKICFELL